MATVLVVDDEPDIVLLAQMALEHEGHVVRTATSGREALAELARSGAPDLMVLDVMMPGLDGWEVLQELKAADDEQVRQVPVVFLTALAAPVDRARGGIEGAVRYMTKPFDPDELARTVAEVLAGEPEPVQRLSAQRRALELLARLEKDAPAAASVGSAAPAAGRLRLTGLERAPEVDGRRSAASGPDLTDLLERMAALTPVQRRTLRVLHAADTVQAAAAELGVSRSNVYASLRRIARRLELESPHELLELVRSDSRFADS